MKPFAPAIAQLLTRAGAGLIAISALTFGTGLAATSIARDNFDTAAHTIAFVFAAVTAATLYLGRLALMGALLTGAFHGITTAQKRNTNRQEPMTREPLGLPPVTITQEIGLHPEPKEPFTVEHLNTGISAADANAYRHGQMQPKAPDLGNTKLLFGLALTGVIAGGGSVAVLAANPGSLTAVTISTALAIAAIMLTAINLTLSFIRVVKMRRYQKASQEFQANVMTILRTQGKLIPLPLEGLNEHGTLVDRMIEDLEDARGLLAANPRDGHALAEGEQKLLAALHDLGVYAKADYEDRPECEAARDSIRAFMDFVVEVTRQADLQTANSPR